MLGVTPLYLSSIQVATSFRFPLFKNVGLFLQLLPDLLELITVVEGKIKVLIGTWWTLRRKEDITRRFFLLAHTSFFPLLFLLDLRFGA